MPPLFSWAEYNIYHKVGNKKRLRDVIGILEKYFIWLEETFRKENGLYSVPIAATMMPNSPREHLYYPIDFNTQQAINALYMSELGDILNDKDIGFKYKRKYFSLKTRINSLMWNDADGFYYDLDREERQIKVKTIASFWTLLAEIPNDDRANRLINHLKDPLTFGLENPFPTLAGNEPAFRDKGIGYRGSVFPCFTFMVIKGLEKYARYEFARECAIRHLYYIIDTLNPENGEKGEKTEKGSLYEAYLPRKEGPASGRSTRASRACCFFPTPRSPRSP